MVVGRSLLASAITVQNQTSLIKFVLNQSDFLSTMEKGQFFLPK